MNSIITTFCSCLLAFTLITCGTPQKEATEEPISEAPAPEPSAPADESSENYLQSVFESLDHLPATSDQSTAKLLLPKNEWTLIPGAIGSSLPEDGRVFLLAQAKSLSLDRAVIIEVELPGVDASIYPQYLLLFDESFNVVHHKELFTGIEGEYNIVRHNIWKYGEGDMLSIAVENGPFGFNLVSWELFQLTKGTITVLEEKTQSFDDYDLSQAYFKLIRDSPVDQEEGPTIKLSELEVAGNHLAGVDDENVLDAFQSPVATYEASGLLEKLGFEVVTPGTGFYESDENRRLIPMKPELGFLEPNNEVDLCDGSSTYFITIEEGSSELVIQREYPQEVHLWKPEEALIIDEGEVSFIAKTYGTEDNEIAQADELAITIYREERSGGWTMVINGEYFVTRLVLIDKFGLTDSDLACG